MKNNKYLIMIAIILVFLIPLLLLWIRTANQKSGPATPSLNNTNNQIFNSPTITIPLRSGVTTEPTEIVPAQRTGNTDIINAQPQDAGKDVPINTPIIITFNQIISPNNTQVTVVPNTPISVNIQANILTITPSSDLTPATTYTFLIRYDPNRPAYIYSFRTIGAPSDTFVFPHQEEDQKDIRLAPDVYVSNKTPYSTNDFSVTADISQTTGNFNFTVTLTGPDKNQDQQDFLNWVRSLGLTEAQINTLEITYQ